MNEEEDRDTGASINVNGSYLGKVQATAGCASCQENVIGEEEHLAYYLFLLLEWGAEGTQAIATGFGFLIQHLEQWPWNI